ncbi:hypothetical protein [Tsukamurella pulmonis]|uniref:Uncharacterized protein n=1 Tax=Tsukamurella pulmonis TaxID=47312 RepID=A0A1H1F6E3_9ACTN|nr:hypothetical protein [Tsukamurella pulmonis]SDQ95986.1 hypothetical protein SAMN04489765_2519 [Tsukamurella pulmonis]SUP20081.1 Uncharacterised protein [Tsukamurella pulmonis]
MCRTQPTRSVGASITLCSTLIGVGPAKVEPGYADLAVERLATTAVCDCGPQ